MDFHSTLTFISHIMPAASRWFSSSVRPSKSMRTGTRCWIFTKLPTELSVGTIEYFEPVALLMAYLLHQRMGQKCGRPATEQHNSVALLSPCRRGSSSHQGRNPAMGKGERGRRRRNWRQWLWNRCRLYAHSGGCTRRIISDKVSCTHSIAIFGKKWKNPRNYYQNSCGDSSYLCTQIVCHDDEMTLGSGSFSGISQQLPKRW